ncbi:MAG: hypothetical protein FJ030_04715 [Chloroflexi bacterium]|nr:hypothetical protein [Chloroflexota bacterium]
MTRKLNRIVFPLAAFVALVALACTCGGSTTPTPAPLPTAAPPTKAPVVLPTEPPATKPPIGSGGAPFTLAADPYVHPGGAFSVSYPDGWEFDERSDGIFINEPGGFSSMDMSFTNVGQPLDADSFNNYIQAIEANWFGGFTDYSQESVEAQQDGSTLVLKTLKTSDSTPYTVFSYYWQTGNVIFEQDFWATDDQYDAYVDGFVEIANSAQTDDSAASGAPLYEFRYTFTCPDSLCTFSAPYGWTYNQNTSFDNTIADVFTAPDGLAYVESVAYDDGTEIARSVAGAFALGLLREFYAQDISVTDDQVQSDGSERLDWFSPSGGYSGETFFETRGTTFLMLTFVANDQFWDLYQPVWSDLVGSYDVP